MGNEQHDILLQFGDSLRKIRTQKRLSQTQLAFETDLTREYINRLENGKVNISLINISIIAKVLDIHISQLLPQNK
ncbi:helix-turn-helix domain-containing protein [Patiriisocius marinus]|uniref:HTH cro/C1-type domain-containing protein n=1 Tax=Patiriisocius marinus TaxID=1397112 RepID=A0A5J4IPS3_9FLAO|nr:helix-turn-helix transcriptional regulator [Patiriisocius marinus]GER59719.1 hypothetical protein ULMA_18270 [Patiriisocius marinus]